MAAPRESVHDAHWGDRDDRENGHDARGSGHGVRENAHDKTLAQYLKIL